MLDPTEGPSLVQGYVDPLATRVAGSLAWWCRWTLDAWDDEHPLADRLRPEEIPTYVAFALHKLDELAPGLASERDFLSAEIMVDAVALAAPGALPNLLDELARVGVPIDALAVQWYDSVHDRSARGGRPRPVRSR